MTKSGKHVASCGPGDFLETVPADVPRFFSNEGKRYDNPSGKGAAHHPTKSFHLWRGEAIAYIHAVAILDALYMIEKDTSTGKTRSVLASEYATSLEGPLPAAKSCDKYYCDKRPICYTNYKPHFNRKRKLDDIIIGR